MLPTHGKFADVCPVCKKQKYDQKKNNGRINVYSTFEKNKCICSTQESRQQVNAKNKKYIQTKPESAGNNPEPELYIPEPIETSKKKNNISETCIATPLYILNKVNLRKYTTNSDTINKDESLEGNKFKSYENDNTLEIKENVTTYSTRYIYNRSKTRYCFSNKRYNKGKASRPLYLHQTSVIHVDKLDKASEELEDSTLGSSVSGDTNALWSTNEKDDTDEKIDNYKKKKEDEYCTTKITSNIVKSTQPRILQIMQEENSKSINEDNKKNKQISNKKVKRKNKPKVYRKKSKHEIIMKKYEKEKEKARKKHKHKSKRRSKRFNSNLKLMQKIDDF